MFNIDWTKLWKLYFAVKCIFLSSVASKKQQIPHFHLILQVETIGEDEKQLDCFFFVSTADFCQEQCQVWGGLCLAEAKS